MQTKNGFVTLGSIIASALISMGGFGLMAVVANAKALYPQSSWKELFHDKREVFLFVAASYLSPTPSILVSSTPTSTPTPTPTEEVKEKVSATLTPTPTVGGEDEEQPDRDDNQDVEVRTSVKTKTHGSMRYKLMQFLK